MPRVHASGDRHRRDRSRVSWFQYPGPTDGFQYFRSVILAKRVSEHGLLPGAACLPSGPRDRQAFHRYRVTGPPEKTQGLLRQYLHPLSIAVEAVATPNLAWIESESSPFRQAPLRHAVSLLPGSKADGTRSLTSLFLFEFVGCYHGSNPVLPQSGSMFPAWE